MSKPVGEIANLAARYKSSSVVSVASTKDGTETPLTDCEDRDDPHLLHLLQSPNPSDFEDSAFVQKLTPESLPLQHALLQLEESWPLGVHKLRPTPGLESSQQLMCNSLAVQGGVLHQAHWTIDVEKFSSKDRHIKSPSFELALGSPSVIYTFRIMIQACEDPSLGKSVSFKSTGGRGCVQLKCETPGDAINMNFRISVGKERCDPVTPIHHDFAKHSVCCSARSSGVRDFLALRADKSARDLVVCLEIFPHSESMAS